MFFQSTVFPLGSVDINNLFFGNLHLPISVGGSSQVDIRLDGSSRDVSMA